MTAPARRKDPKAPPTTGPASPPCWRLPRHSRERPCPTRCAFAFFGAEENGLNGSRAYAASLDTDAVAKLLAMVNYDTIAGVTSSMSTRPTLTWPSTTAPTREPLQLRSQGARSPAGHLPADRHPVRHPPQLQRLPGRGDRQLVRSCPLCLPGVPIAYVEATNFTINGEDGYDGYSQSTNPGAVGLLRRRHQERLRPGTARPSGARFGTRSMIASTRWPSSSRPDRAAARGQYRPDDPLPQGAGALTPSRPMPLTGVLRPDRGRDDKIRAGAKPALFLWIL